MTVRIIFSSSSFLTFSSSSSSSRGGDSPRKAAEVTRPQKLNIFQHLNEEEINKTYEEWMKIAADNVSSTCIVCLFVCFPHCFC